MRRIEREGHECGDDPGPGAEGVMRDVEPESCAKRIFFVLRAENSLRDVTTAAGFRARIPTAPPLDAQKEDEGDERNGPESFACETVRKVWKEGKRIGDGAASLCSFSADDAEPQCEGASTMTIPIFKMNWKRSVTRTPQRPPMNV